MQLAIVGHSLTPTAFSADVNTSIFCLPGAMFADLNRPKFEINVVIVSFDGNDLAESDVSSVNVGFRNCLGKFHSELDYQNVYH